MAQHIVIGTAGHVDHGKTTLVKALTGIETDTTAEEKKRGLTINLGFAYLDLPNGRRVGIVDVPGHEKFIKNMVAGLPGINMILLVIDANEGVMPQTREHLDILTLLGVTHFLIVLTKIDTVDGEMRDLVREDIREQLAQTAAADADIVEADALTGTGMAALVEKIQAMTEAIPEVDDHGQARLHVDRIFTVKGFGTVVTGTLLDGVVHVGDTLYLYPPKEAVRVRNIQVHEQNVTKAEPSQRTALNLANISADDIQRGDILAATADLAPSWMIDVKVQCLRHSPVPIRLWDRLRLLIGTTEVMVRAVPLGVEQINPGEEGFLQLRLEEKQVITKAYDRFILRTFSPMETIAGGEVLDANPKKHRRFKEAILQSLRAKEDGQSDVVVGDFLRHYTLLLATASDIAAQTHLPEDTVTAALAQLEENHVVRRTPIGYMHEDTFKKWRSKAVQLLLTYHRQYPLRQGMVLSEFRSRLANSLPDKTITALLEQFVAAGACRVTQGLIAGSHFHVTFTAAQEKTREALRKELAKNKYTATRLDDVAAKYKDGAAVLDAMNGEDLVFLSHQYGMSKTYYDQAVAMTRQYLQEHGSIDVQAFRDMTQSSRKSTFVVLEYMDSQHVTKRIENYRVLGEEEA